jgi:hypothetical protein
VTPAERAGLETWTTAAERRVFDSMHIADQRHGLDVVTSLRAGGIRDSDVLVAGLLHDAGKGATGVWPRVAYSLGQHYGRWIWGAAAVLPGFGDALACLRDHADVSAHIAEEAGCSPRAVDLIRYQDTPRDPEFGELLRRADEAN